MRPGDLVFTEHLGHVQLYTGNGRVIEAPHTGTTVRYAPLPTATTVTTYRHITPPPAAAAKPAPTRPTTTPAAAVAPAGTPRQTAAALFGPQYNCAAQIITRESSWNPRAVNTGSGAYGLGQALPATKMAPFGPDWATNPTTQLRWMHKGDAIRRWAKKNRVELCFTPTYASWANPIEAHLGPLRRFTVANSDHHNHTVQTQALHAYLRWRNSNARHPDVLAAQRKERARIRSEKRIRWGGRQLAAAT